MIIYLNTNNIIGIHDQQIEMFGGVPGIRDRNLLESAVEQIQQNMFGKELYETLEDKVVRLGFCIARNHVFNDANKRTEFNSMILMLEVNDVEINYNYLNSDDAIRFMEKLATGHKSESDIVDWIDNKLKR